MGDKPFDDIGVNHIWIGKMKVPLANLSDPELNLCNTPPFLVLYEFNVYIREAVNFRNGRLQYVTLEKFVFRRLDGIFWISRQPGSPPWPRRAHGEIAWVRNIPSTYFV